MQRQTTYTVLTQGGITSAKGFSATGIYAGIKKKKNDLALLYSEVPATAAGVFTTNLVRAACVEHNQQQLASFPQLQAIVVNSGNANACTGEQGEQDDLAMRQHTAKLLTLSDKQVAVASTGVIGVPLPMQQVISGIEQAVPTLSTEGGERFAEAILTTDTRKKEIALQLEIDGKTVTIGGAAKGSGMIHPNMATMLAFVTTDANISARALKGLLASVTDLTYNCITVDGDTSTNDMVLVMANGLAENQPLDENHPQWLDFVQSFTFVCEYLAKEIARDGEGATKLIEVEVENAPTQEIAIRVAKSVVGSSLVKTAVYGADANWGRILCAAGYSGAKFDIEKLTIFIGEVQVFAQGMPIKFDEELAKQQLLAEEVVLRIDMQQGNACAKAYGCDLTYDYVRINASYRT